MFIVGILGWWYTAGWRHRAVMLGERLAATMDYFSIDLLLKTLFSPFRQISAGSVQGSLNAQIQALGDKIISRMIGMMIRLVMIFIGSITILFHAVIGTVLLLLWAVVPLLPVVGVVLALTGWIPWKL